MLRRTRNAMQCCGSQRMRADRLLLVLRALALESLVFSSLTVVDIVVDSLAISNLIMAERQDTCMRFGLLARRERFIERQNAFDLETFGFLAGEFRPDHLLAHLPEFLLMTEGFPKSEELPQDQQRYEDRRPKKDSQL